MSDMRMDQSFKSMEQMFKRNFPSQTKGKDSAAVRKIMREMGYGYGTGLNKAMRKSKGISKFEDGGDVAKPKMRPKSLKADKTKIINEEFSKKVAKQNEKAKKMEKGGEAVPSKYKGFSKLPEKVQQKIDPNLASKYEYGGSVKGKGGKMMCRGQGAARAGKGFSIR